MRPFIKTVLLITLIAGTLDIIAAMIHVTVNTGRFPNRIFQAIASGMVGRDMAFAGGLATHALGVYCSLFYCIQFYGVLFSGVSVCDDAGEE